jgi:hypothetical protein
MDLVVVVGAVDAVDGPASVQVGVRAGGVDGRWTTRWTTGTAC